MTPGRPLRTVDLARAAGTHVNTVRLYERLGWIAPAARSSNRYRAFTPDHQRQMCLARLALAGPWSGRKIRRSALHLAQVAAVVCVALALADGGLALPLDPRGLLAVAGMGVVSTVVAMTAFLAGMALVGPTRASVLSSLEVIVTLVLAFALLGERLGPGQWAGAALILGAVAFQNLGVLRRAMIGLSPRKP